MSPVTNVTNSCPQRILFFPTCEILWREFYEDVCGEYLEKRHPLLVYHIGWAELWLWVKTTTTTHKEGLIHLFIQTVPFLYSPPLLQHQHRFAVKVLTPHVTVVLFTTSLKLFVPLMLCLKNLLTAATMCYFPSKSLVILTTINHDQACGAKVMVPTRSSACA